MPARAWIQVSVKEDGVTQTPRAAGLGLGLGLGLKLGWGCLEHALLKDGPPRLGVERRQGIVENSGYVL